MTQLRSFALPDVGEGLTEAEIVSWLVAPGDRVAVNQPIAEIETAKAVVELPSPFEGLVVELLVEVGQLVPVGTELIRFEVSAAAEPVPTPPPSGAVQVHREPVLVGYGTATEPVARRARTARGVRPAASAAPDVAVVEPIGRTTNVLAPPPVRALARSLGVDLAAVTPTRPDGVLTRDDVSSFAARGAGHVTAEPPAPPRRIEAGSIPVRGVLRSMAEAMTQSAFTAPHVTEWVAVDVTASVELLERLRTRYPDVRFTPLTLIAAALVRAARRNPRINGRWNETEILLPDHVDLGLAVATDRGLLVPHLPGADRLGIVELARQLDQIVTAARNGTLTPAQLTGGTITITNVGVFGVDGGTPILSPGQAAILCAGRIAPRPWVVTDANGVNSLAIRQVMELTLSFDHRVVDGAIGSKALRDVADFLADPAATLLLD